MTPKTLAVTTRPEREKCIVHLQSRELLLNMVSQRRPGSLSSSREWENGLAMPDGLCNPLTQVQQTEDETDQEYKHKNRIVICGNFTAWGEHSTTTTNLDAPLLRLMLSLASAQDTTWSSIDITSAFLNTDIHEDDTVLVKPPILVKMNTVKPNTVWHVKTAIDGLREAPHLWQGERDQQARELQFLYQDKPAHLA